MVMSLQNAESNESKSCQEEKNTGTIIKLILVDKKNHHVFLFIFLLGFFSCFYNIDNFSNKLHLTDWKIVFFPLVYIN